MHVFSYTFFAIILMNYKENIDNILGLLMPRRSYYHFFYAQLTLPKVSSRRGLVENMTTGTSR